MQRATVRIVVVAMLVCGWFARPASVAHAAASSPRIWFTSFLYENPYTPDYGGEFSTAYSMDSDGTCMTKMTRDRVNVGSPWPSPDGQRVVVASKVSGTWDIWTASVDGGDWKQLTTGPDLDAWPEWSADGSWIVFTRYLADGTGTTEIGIVHPDGTGLRMLTSGPHDSFASISPDGTRVSFARNDPTSEPPRLYIVNTDGSDLHEVPGISTFEHHWSPDGQWIVWADGFNFFFAHPDGSGVRSFASSGTQPAWFPDGTRLAYLGMTHEIPLGLYAVGSDGSDPHPMYPRYLQAPRPSVGVRAFDPVERIAGEDRYRTAAEASRERWFEGSPGAIVIARGDQAGGGADALAGSPLAAAKGGPLLLNPPDQLDPEVRIEVRRFTDPNMVVYLLGGPQALSPAVEQAITDMGVTVRRIAGADRYDTAVKIAEELGNPSTLFEADGTGFADALTAGAAAAHVNAAILLTDGNLQSPATGAYLAQHSTTTRYAVGGPAALADPTATRIAGADRYETAVAVAQRFFGDGPDIGLASGTGFADGLPAGAFLFQVNAPLLLTAPTATLPPSVQSYLSDHASALHCARVFGGTTVVPESIRDVIRDTISAS